MMDNPAELLLAVTSCEEEVLHLSKLRQDLIPPSDIFLDLEGDEDIFEKEWLRTAASTPDDDNPFPDKSVTDIFLNQNDLDKFTHYLFERRFGWSEVGIISADVGGKKVGSGKQKEVKYKTTLNDLLDDYIRWYLCQTMCSPILEGLRYTILQAAQKPVVRNQCMVHIMEWIKINGERLQVQDFTLIKGLILIGVTDIWSAIRNATISRLGPIVEYFSLLQLEEFFTDLVKICQNDASNWQSKEGAVMGINTVVRKFQTVGMLHQGETSEYLVKFGKLELAHLPKFLTNQIQVVIYPLLAHPQLSIREHAIKAFSSYLARCGPKEQLSSFNDVIRQLCRGTEACEGGEQAKKVKVLPHLATLRSDYEFLDAYTAEGLLGVCVFLVKHIPPEQLMNKENWERYFSTFNLYLMHPASTVRQATSTIFKFIVAKDCNNPELLNLVLKELSSEWKPNKSLLNKPITTTTPRRLSSEGLGDQAAIRSDSFSKRTRGSTKRAGSTLSRRLTITKISAIESEDKSVSDTWEWREGRLFAYELIVKFLIKNHLFHTFGPSDKPGGHTRVFGTTSVDESQMLKEMGQAHDTIMKTQSYGGVSLQKAITTTVRDKDQHHKGHNRKKSMDEVKEEVICSKTPPQRTTISMATRESHHQDAETRSQSERDQQLKQYRMATVGNFGDTDQTIQHLNKYTKWPSGTNRASSLLTVTKMVETQTNKGPSVSFSELLKDMMYQTIECLSDVRWEIRRMGQQVLPHLIEAIRWYNMSVLEELWNEHITPNTTLICYGACLALKYSLSHAAKLKGLHKEPPSSWQDVKVCRKIIDTITETTKSYLPVWMKCVHTLLQRPVFDKLSVVAMEILLLGYGNFHECLIEQRNIHEPTMLNHLRNVFLNSSSEALNEDSNLVKVLRDLGGCRPFMPPGEGFLSCSTKGDTSQSAQQYERLLLSETHSSLLRYLEGTNIAHTAFMMPLLVRHIHTFTEETHICSSFVNSVEVLANKANAYLSSSNREDNSSNKEVHLVMPYCILAIQELANTLIASKAGDLSILRQSLELIGLISRHIPKEKHLTLLFQAIISRLKNSNACLDTSNEDDDIYLMSNDIRPSPIMMQELDSDEEVLEPRVPDNMLQESLTLNVSSGSGSGPSGRLSAMTNSSTDGRVMSPASNYSDAESDWDNWSDDEEDQVALTEIFHSFLQTLTSQYNAPKQRQQFQQELKRLSDKERKLIENLINNGSL
ncbi:unnamed protein product [Owenia fusiformis]|uniref:Uncharacterized protein n=1 Tax=Owenia fusiformis TaxID=6347 RepID=A0A8J1URG5_OWEFU|nr:unnamed protein product [Owenia fusiformis]